MILALKQICNHPATFLKVLDERRKTKDERDEDTTLALNESEDSIYPLGYFIDIRGHFCKQHVRHPVQNILQKLQRRSHLRQHACCFRVHELILPLWLGRLRRKYGHVQRRTSLQRIYVQRLQQDCIFFGNPRKTWPGIYD